jgi:hypothetical protein
VVADVATGFKDVQAIGSLLGGLKNIPQTHYRLMSPWDSKPPETDRIAEFSQCEKKTQPATALYGGVTEAAAG